MHPTVEVGTYDLELQGSNWIVKYTGRNQSKVEAALRKQCNAFWEHKSQAFIIDAIQHSDQELFHLVKNIAVGDIN